MKQIPSFGSAEALLSELRRRSLTGEDFRYISAHVSAVHALWHEIQGGYVTVTTDANENLVFAAKYVDVNIFHTPAREKPRFILQEVLPTEGKLRVSISQKHKPSETPLDVVDQALQKALGIPSNSLAGSIIYRYSCGNFSIPGVDLDPRPFAGFWMSRASFVYTIDLPNEVFRPEGYTQPDGMRRFTWVEMPAGLQDPQP